MLRPLLHAPVGNLGTLHHDEAITSSGHHCRYSRSAIATTSCSVAIQAFGSDKRAGEVLAGAPFQEVLEVGNYILNIMDQLDRQGTNAGEQGSGRTSQTRGSTRLQEAP